MSFSHIQPEREKIIELTTGNTLPGPGSIPWEVGIAFSSMFKQGRLDLDEAKKGITIFQNIPIRYLEVDLFNAVLLAKQTNSYAYDAYFLDCALRYSTPILTLDHKLKETAQNLGIETLEV